MYVFQVICSWLHVTKISCIFQYELPVCFVVHEPSRGLFGFFGFFFEICKLNVHILSVFLYVWEFKNFFKQLWISFVVFIRFFKQFPIFSRKVFECYTKIVKKTFSLKHRFVLKIIKEM